MENIVNPPFLISLTFSSAGVPGLSATKVQAIQILAESTRGGTVGTQVAYASLLTSELLSAKPPVTGWAAMTVIL